MLKNINIPIEEIIKDTNISSPLDQFEIKDILSIKGEAISNTTLSMTNIGLYLVVTMMIVLSYSLISSNRQKIIPNN